MATGATPTGESPLPPVHALAMWAAFESSRASHAADEWRAAGLGFAAIYGLLGVLPRGSLQAFDLVTVVLLIGTGLYMGRFCRRTATTLRKLTKGLLDTSHASVG